MTCLNCGSHATLAPDRIIAVGFGQAGYTKDGVELWTEDLAATEDEYHTVADVERLAASEPDSDWRIYFHAPLYDAVYQRQKGVWVLIEKGDGFA